MLPDCLSSTMAVISSVPAAGLSCSSSPFAFGTNFAPLSSFVGADAGCCGFC